MEIRGECKSSGELGKRFYVPGVEVVDKCPKCGTEHVRDLGDYYLSYPSVGEPIEINGYCRNEACEHEWVMGSIVVGITITPAPAA